MAIPTRSEAFVGLLCERAMLQLWSYPSPFRDQPGKNGGTVGQELCDLLAVCGQTLIIFSIKECAFQTAVPLGTAWPRWFKKAIRKSVDQIRGAERWILDHPGRIFKDASCSAPLDAAIPQGPDVRIHRVVVALGCAEASKQARGCNCGLHIWCALRDLEHEDSLVSSSTAFSVGDIQSTGGFVHVLDDTSLDVILTELDTFSDLSDYFDRRAKFLRSPTTLGAHSERDLLAVYLTNVDAEDTHAFPSPSDERPLYVHGDSWNNYVQSNGYAVRRKLNAISYYWDSIINQTIRSVKEKTAVGELPTVQSTEEALRIMAQEPRVYRRFLSEKLVEIVNKGGPTLWARRYLRPFHRKDVGYVFVAHPAAPAGKSEWREIRAQLLADCSLVFASRFRELTRIVAIGTEGGGLSPIISHDVGVLRQPVWTPELENEVREIEVNLGILNRDTLEMQHHQGSEYAQPQKHNPVVSTWVAELAQRAKAGSTESSSNTQDAKG